MTWSRWAWERRTVPPYFPYKIYFLKKVVLSFGGLEKLKMKTRRKMKAVRKFSFRKFVIRGKRMQAEEEQDTAAASGLFKFRLKPKCGDPAHTCGVSGTGYTFELCR